MAETPSLFVARETDLAALGSLWEEAKAGNTKLVRLQAPFGGGRRALVTEFLRGVNASNDDAILWRVAPLDHENGVQWLVRMYGALVASVSQDILRRGKVEMVLNSQLPTQTARVQRWYQAFVSTIKEAKTDPETGQVKLRIPQDNPLLGLVEVVVGISRKVPIVLDVQSAYGVQSLLPALFFETVLDEARESGGKLMMIAFDEVPGEVVDAIHPQPLRELWDRRSDTVDVHQVAPWTADETSAYLASKGLTSDAARIAEITGGRPGFIAEFIDILSESDRLGDDLSDVTLKSLAPMGVDTDELDIPEGPPAEGERPHVTADALPQAAFFAALLGQAFPSSLVANIGGWDRESVDDLVDATDGLFDEVQYAEEMKSWIYKFKRGCWREGILEMHDTEEGRALALKVATWMERFLVPRGPRFMTRTARVYAENGAANRASMLRAVALSNDNPDAWGMAYECTKYFDEVGWSEPLRRTVYTNLVDKLTGAGRIPAAEKAYGEIAEWVDKQDDRGLSAWYLFAGSKLDARRQDLFRARDRARDAITLYEGLGEKARVAEIYNHLAGIELQDGNPNAANENITKALEHGSIEQEDKKGYIPGILAQAEFFRGTIVRRGGDPKKAIEHFNRSTSIAGQIGLGGLALDAGVAMGEALLVTRQIDRAIDVLNRVAQGAGQSRSAMRERAANELLGQAYGAKRDYAKASQAATRTLQLTQSLGFKQMLPIDLYNLGFFQFAGNNPTEALSLFRQAEQRVGDLGKHPIVKELYYFMGIAQAQTNELDAARVSLTRALELAEEAKDARKLVSCHENLAGIDQKQGDTQAARKQLETALALAKQHDLKENRKSIKKKLDALA